VSINDYSLAETVKPVPGFDDLVDQDRPVRLIKAALCNGNIPPAFLFTGRSGTGKKTAALAFAMACNCLVARQANDRDSAKAAFDKAHRQYRNDPCGTCRSCQKISAGTHPDILIVRPIGTIIKVEQVRSLCRRLALKPNEASVRLALIDGAHLMNAEAANTLLKTLEEPPESTVFVLTAPQSLDLLSTIVSRCRHIPFSPISNRHLASFLSEKYGIDANESDVMAAMAGGSFTNAAAMAESGWIKKRNWIIEQIEFLSCNSIRYALAFSETLSKNKNWLTDAFYIMKIWYRDMVFAKISPEYIVNKDLLGKIQHQSPQTPIEKMLSNIKAIEQAERNILSNTNARITLDALVLMLFGEKTKNGTCYRR
jgi:DNA polymerase III subunit delta'